MNQITTTKSMQFQVNGYEIKRNADLSGANLKGAKVGAATTWPEGFDPKAAGVIFE